MSEEKGTTLTKVARYFSDDELVVTKTDTKGLITYANQVFVNISGYTEAELLGRPHNMIRHPHMPRIIFKLLWDHINSKKEVFAYVCNRCKNGDHYWVFAHVTPNFDSSGNTIGFHSNRRNISEKALKIIEPLYKVLFSIENESDNHKEAMERSFAKLADEYQKLGYSSYDEFVLDLGCQGEGSI